MSKLHLPFVSLVVLISSVSMLVGCTPPRNSAGGGQPAPLLEPRATLDPSGGALPADTLEDTWGVQIQSALLSAGGYMVDLRFRVVDAAKATPLFDRKTKPYLIDQATGATFAVPTPPKVGQLRSGGNIKEGKVYFVFFANPAKYVKSGNKVTVVIGDFRAQDVVVQ